MEQDRITFIASSNSFSLGDFQITFIPSFPLSLTSKRTKYEIHMADTSLNKCPVALSKHQHHARNPERTRDRMVK